MPISSIILPIKEILPFMKYISVEDAGKKFNLSARSIRNYCSQGRIPGAVLSGKTWLIPNDAKKPDRANSKNEETALENLRFGNDLVSFISESPVACYAIKNVSNILIKKGYKEVKEYHRYNFKAGDKVFIVRNDTTIVAFNIGKNVDENHPYFHVVVSHADSPSFKVKPEANTTTDKYNKINVAPYGGMIVSSWLDRPLSIAGKVVINKDNSVKTELVNLSDYTLFMPNVCIHFNRDINSGYDYNMAVDPQPFVAFEDNTSLKDEIAFNLKLKKEDIVNFDLFLYNKQSGIVWGKKNEFISSSRLDDLMCVYTSSIAFSDTNNDNAINVLYIADNEEVGSSSNQGADSDFLKSSLLRVCKDLNLEYEVAVANSFLVSADNGHAVHPNKPYLTDSDNKIYMNKGIAIKFNATGAYTSDAISSAIFQKICDNASVPYQFFTNRSDVRGGATLGRILLSQVSLMSVDIGLAQLAMHSSYETAGTKDIKYAIDAFKEFYSSNIVVDGNSYKITK